MDGNNDLAKKLSRAREKNRHRNEHLEELSVEAQRLHSTALASYQAHYPQCGNIPAYVNPFSSNGGITQFEGGSFAIVLPSKVTSLENDRSYNRRFGSMFPHLSPSDRFAQYVVHELTHVMDFHDPLHLEFNSKDTIGIMTRSEALAFAVGEHITGIKEFDETIASNYRSIHSTNCLKLHGAFSSFLRYSTVEELFNSRVEIERDILK